MVTILFITLDFFVQYCASSYPSKMDDLMPESFIPLLSEYFFANHNLLILNSCINFF